MDVKVYGLLVEVARHGRTIAYSQTGRPRGAIGPILDEINRHEATEGRPMLSVVVVHKDTTDPGEGFLDCARSLKRFREGDDKKAFVDRERADVFETWAPLKGQAN